MGYPRFPLFANKTILLTWKFYAYIQVYANKDRHRARSYIENNSKSLVVYTLNSKNHEKPENEISIHFLKELY